jgi:ribulose-phosphate 3-epimerase
MGVKPGHAGHLYLPHVDQKLEELIAIKNRYHLEIMMDGACSLERMVKWSKRHVDGFVLGTSSLFGHRGSYKDIIDHIKRACGE